MKINNKGFTVVELVVMVIIIGILSTIGFVSFSGFLGSTRDANRISQISEMYDGFIGLQLRNQLPLPTDYIEIKRGDKVISYQGKAGSRILNQMEYTDTGYDPGTRDFFTYSLTQNRKSIAILALLENDPELEGTLVYNNTFAEGEEFKYPFIEGEKVGVIITDDNIPVNTIVKHRESGEFNVVTELGKVYKLLLSNDEVYTGNGPLLYRASRDYSCKRIKDLDPGTENGQYRLDVDGDNVRSPIYCNMEIEGGGWSLLLKADGEETTFGYDSSLWENSATYNPDEFRFDRNEYKSGLFSTLGFTEIMLELHTEKSKKYIILPVPSTSLQDLFTSGYIQTNAGREDWKTLIPESSLQLNCNREGINVEPSSGSHAKVRIGILGNEQDDCDTPDSRLGIGGQGQDSLTVGNYAGIWDSDNGDVSISSFGYLYVR